MDTLVATIGETIVVMGKIMLESKRENAALAILENGVVCYPLLWEIQLQLGVCYQAMGRHQDAYKYFSKVLALDNTQAEGYYYRGVSGVYLKEPSAMMDLNKAIALAPTFWKAYFTRASLYARQGNYPQAILNCNAALKLNSKLHRGLLMRGCLKCLMGNYTLALEDLNATILANANCALAFFNRAVCYEKLSNSPKALQDYETALSLDFSVRTMVLRNRSLLLFREARYAEALTDLLALSAMIESSHVFGKDDLPLLHTIGLCLLRVGHHDIAANYLNLCIEINPTFVAARIALGNVFFSLNTSRGIELSLREYAKAIRLDVACLPAYVNMSHALQARGDLSLARNLLGRALQIDRHYTPALEARAVLYLQLSRFDEAYLDLTRAIEMEPHNALCLATRGVVNLYMHDVKGAMADLQRAVQMNGKLPLAHYNIGIVYLINKQYTQAKSHFLTVLRINENDSYARFSLGVALGLMKEYRESISELRKLVSMSPDFSHAYYNMAVSYVHLKQWKEARDLLNTYLELQPSDGAAYELRGLALGKMGLVEEAMKDTVRATTLLDNLFVPSSSN